jgi:MraZ protein
MSKGVQDRQLYKGHMLNAIDGKGRVAIPASMRAVLERNGDSRAFTLAIHARDACLIGYDRSWSALQHDRLEREEARERDAGRDFDYHNAFRRAFGTAEELTFDSSGRFILPAFYRQKASLEDLALFIGTGNTFELWNPRRLLETPGIDEATREIAAFLLHEREGA